MLSLSSPCGTARPVHQTACRCKARNDLSDRCIELAREAREERQAATGLPDSQWSPSWLTRARPRLSLSRVSSHAHRPAVRAVRRSRENPHERPDQVPGAVASVPRAPRPCTACRRRTRRRRRGSPRRHPSRPSGTHSGRGARRGRRRRSPPSPASGRPSGSARRTARHSHSRRGRPRAGVRVRAGLGWRPPRRSGSHLWEARRRVRAPAPPVSPIQAFRGCCCASSSRMPGVAAAGAVAPRQAWVSHRAWWRPAARAGEPNRPALNYC